MLTWINKLFFKKDEDEFYLFLLLKFSRMNLCFQKLAKFIIIFKLLQRKQIAQKSIIKKLILIIKCSIETWNIFTKGKPITNYTPMVLEKIWQRKYDKVSKVLYILYKNNINDFFKVLDIYNALQLPLPLLMQEFAILKRNTSEVLGDNINIKQLSSNLVYLFVMRTTNYLLRNKILKDYEIADPYRFETFELFKQKEYIISRIGIKKDVTRSIVFLHNSYYNFYYLAKVLRKRGWDAISVSIQSPDEPENQFYHGEDLNLYDADTGNYEKKLTAFYDIVKGRYKMLHFYGGGSYSIFPKNRSRTMQNIPWDFLELRAAGIKLGYTQSGCNDLILQSSFYSWSQGSCERCVWKDIEVVCSDSVNSIWGQTVQYLCQLICSETDPQLDYKKGDNVFPDPLTLAIDSEIWSPDIKIPEEFILPKSEGEIIIYHGVGNYELRTKNNKDFKGTHAVFQAIEKLKNEGINVRLEFVTNMKSSDVRYIQAQADIVVEQLNYGRYGATAREAMMLGIPTVTYINKEKANEDISPCIEQTPIISATEETIYETLLDLIKSPEKRSIIGKNSREHAIKWWSADACAEKFEYVYDGLMQGKTPRQLANELRKRY